MKKSATPKAAGTLSVVATPIGNYSDITLRALEALKESDVVVCEESKEAIRLLKHYDMEKEIIELNEHNDTESSVECMKLLTAGKKLALISDAGTPLLADPGDILVKAAVKYNIDVRVLPGASSVLTALVRSTFNTRQFIYAGFLSRKNEERDREIRKLARENRTIVLMDTPYRLKTILAALAEVMPDRQAYVGCNLTMSSEAHQYGSLKQLEAHFEEHKFRGEYVIVIEGSSEVFDDVEVYAEQRVQASTATQEQSAQREEDSTEQQQRPAVRRLIRASTDADPLEEVVTAIPVPESDDDAPRPISIDDYEPVSVLGDAEQMFEGGEAGEEQREPQREHGGRDGYRERGGGWNNNGPRRWNNKRRWDNNNNNNNRRFQNGDRPPRDGDAPRPEQPRYDGPRAEGVPPNNGGGYRSHGNNRQDNQGNNRRSNNNGYRNNRNNGRYRPGFRDDREAPPNAIREEQQPATNQAESTNSFYDESYDRRENFGNREGANYSRFDQNAMREGNGYNKRPGFNRGPRPNRNFGRPNPNEGNRRDGNSFGYGNDQPPKRRRW